MIDKKNLVTVQRQNLKVYEKMATGMVVIKKSKNVTLKTHYTKNLGIAIK